MYYVLDALERVNKEEKKEQYTPHPNDWGMVNRLSMSVLCHSSKSTAHLKYVCRERENKRKKNKALGESPSDTKPIDLGY